MGITLSNISNQNLKKSLSFEDGIKSYDLAYVLFTSDSCYGCTRIEKTLYEIGKQGPRIFLVHIEGNDKLCEKYTITKTPTVVVFEKGKIKAHLIGVYPESKYFSYMQSPVISS